MADDPYPDDVPTVSYSAYFPADIWTDWQRDLNRPAYVRLRELIAADRDSPTPPSDVDTVARILAVESDTWTQWLQSIPQTEEITARLADLIDRDIAEHKQANREMEEASARVIGQRLSIRATQARGALRDGDDNPRDIEQAMDILDDIVELANTLKQ